MFKILRKPTPKKMYSIHFKVYADSKAIAEFYVKAPGHNKRQALELAKKKVSLKPVKAFLFKSTK